MTDQCKHCTLRGDISACMSEPCHVRENWFAEGLAADNATLRTALHTQAEESAKLIEQRDWLLAAINAALHQMRHTSYHPCKTEPMGILDAAIEKATN